mmetsp:Transcript_52003/g.108606  ORF Transcript_52003/g.108606 Transcript_52003/m.108606 type:complete len:97 (+) Transcript_52003:347-637(+)
MKGNHLSTLQLKAHSEVVDFLQKKIAAHLSSAAAALHSGSGNDSGQQNDSCALSSSSQCVIHSTEGSVGCDAALALDQDAAAGGQRAEVDMKHSYF